MFKWMNLGVTNIQTIAGSMQGGEVGSLIHSSANGFWQDHGCWWLVLWKVLSRPRNTWLLHRCCGSKTIKGYLQPSWHLKCRINVGECSKGSNETEWVRGKGLIGVLEYGRKRIRSQSRNKNGEEIVEMRYGHWSWHQTMMNKGQVPGSDITPFPSSLGPGPCAFECLLPLMYYIHSVGHPRPLWALMWHLKRPVLGERQEKSGQHMLSDPTLAISHSTMKRTSQDRQ